MPRLLIVHHSPTATLQRITDQVVAGAHDDAISGVEVEVAEALTVELDSIEAADGVHGRYDTTGAVRSVLAITGALPWRQAAEVLSVLGDPTEGQLAAAYELGGTIAALLGD